MSNRILIAEDDEDVVEVLKKKLFSAEYEVIVANNGQEAVDKTKRYQPDLILMDIDMPDMDGAEALRTIKKDSSLKEIPVIFLTGMLRKGKEEEVQLGTHVDGEKYDSIAKPFDFQELLDKIQEKIG